MKKIALNDLTAQYLSAKEEIDAAIGRVVSSGRFILGPEVEQFEKEFANYCGIKFAVGCSSGTTALHLALLACGIKEGDEVIVPVNTFIAVAEAVSMCRAHPIFIDIDPRSFNIKATELEKVITKRTKAVMVVHSYGQPAEMDQIIDIAGQHGIRIIEDCAHAHGSEYKGKRVASFGDVACFSFFPAKNLGAFGDAGMMVTNGAESARLGRLLVNHGREAKYEHLLPGYNYRLDALQAAVLRAKLRYLDKWNEQCIRLAQKYNQSLQDVNVSLPWHPEYVKHTYYLFVIRTARRDELQDFLANHGIETGIHYPICLHLQPAYRSLGYKPGDFPHAETAAKEILSLPMHPFLKDEDLEYIVEKIKQFLGKSSGRV